MKKLLDRLQELEEAPVKSEIREGFIGSHGYMFTPDRDSMVNIWDTVNPSTHNKRLPHRRIKFPLFMDLEEHALAKRGIWESSNGMMVILREHDEFSVRTSLVFDSSGLSAIIAEGTTSVVSNNQFLRKAIAAAGEYFAMFPRGE